MRSHLLTVTASAGLALIFDVLASWFVTAAGSSPPQEYRPNRIGRSPGNFFNPSNPQDRSGSSNRQDMTQPRAINPQDMR